MDDFAVVVFGCILSELGICKQIGGVVLELIRFKNLYPPVVAGFADRFTVVAVFQNFQKYVVECIHLYFPP